MPNLIEPSRVDETLEVDIDHFSTRYALALQGCLAVDEEKDILEIASQCMVSGDLDEATRELFQSAFFVISKKNKRFIDLRKMNRMLRDGEIGCKF